MAAIAEDQEYVNLLLQRQVNVNAIRYYYHSTLQTAALCKQKLKTLDDHYLLSELKVYIRL